MSFKKIALAVLAAAAVLPAMAQPTAGVSPETLRRAEVLADLDMWHAAGMPNVAAQSEIGVDPAQTAQYRAYTELRNGPRYTAAVQSHLRGTAVVSRDGATVTAR